MESNRFSKRVETLAPSSIRKMGAIAKKLKNEGKTVYELNIGQPDIPCIRVFREAVAAKVREGYLNYSFYCGELFLRETFARYLNHYFARRDAKHLVVDTENVLITCGASHALTTTFLAICDSGDEVLVVEPFSQPYAGFLQVAGGILKPIPTQAERNFALPDDGEIEARINKNTKAILFNSPCNPSGKIFSGEEVTRLAKIAIKYNIFLIADEVYREMILGENEAFSLLQVDLEPQEMEKLKDLIIVIDSASKSFSLCGARIGFVVSKAPIIEKISMTCFHTVASVSDLLQFGVATAYDYALSNFDYFNNLRNTYRERLEAALQAVKEFLPSVLAPRPEGAFYLMLQFPEIEDVTDFALFMLERFNLGGETVAITPAGNFYLTPGLGKNQVRLALVVGPEKIRRSIQIIAEAYKAYERFLENQGKAAL